ncbi:MAG TPA: ABC transporter permease, partial [Anaerolineales bacterium]|nr:ABC transporter permease [Anaerolineales bacterium]
YAIVDPRIRLGGNQHRVKATRVRRRFNPLKWFQTRVSSFKWKKPDRVSSLKPNRTLNLVLVVILMVVIGVLFGAAFGWLVWPVEYTDATPADLAPSYQVKYVQLLIDSFNLNQDSGLANQRLNSLGENTTQALNQFIQTAEDNSITQESLAYFAQTFDINADPPDTSQTTSSTSQDVSGRIFSLVLIIIGGTSFIWVSISVYLKMVNHRARKQGDKKNNGQSAKHKEEQISNMLLPKQRTHRLKKIFRELVRYPSAVIGMIILLIMIAGSLFAIIRYPYQEIGARWYQAAMYNSRYVPRTASPKWINFFRKLDIPETITASSQEMPETKTVKYLDNGNPDYTFTFTFDYPYQDFPSEGMLYFDTNYEKSKPFATFIWTTPDGREFELDNAGIEHTERYDIEDNIDRRDLASQKIQYKFSDNDVYGIPVLNGLFADPESETPIAIPGTYTLEIKVLSFEPETNVDIEMVLMGKIYGFAGTDFMRRDLTVPMLWGMPFALGIGMFGALLTTIVSMLFAAFGVWFGGWADNLVQRVTEANMILPVVAIAVLFYAFYGASLWMILGVIVVLNAFGSPTKTFRAAFIQVKDAGYIEAAQAYGASNRRIIFRYMIPRILPVIIPQLVTLIPGFIFLEATLGMFNVKSNLPTWGKVIYEALSHGAAWGSKFWVLEPIALLLLTGFAFSMMGFALDRVLNPRLQQGD